MMGSDFDDFLAEEGILEEVTARAHKRLLALQLQDVMNESQLTKTELAECMQTRMNDDTMQALTFWKTITMDQSGFLEQIVAALEDNRILYCVIGGQGVNAYVDPLVSLDLDLVIAADQIDEVEALLAAGQFQVKRFPHSLNVSLPGSSLRLQIQTAPRYAAFPQRATRRQVLGLSLPVAAAPDLLAGKVWAFQDPTRRASKRQKDLADIARLLERYPALRSHVPEEVLARLV